MGDWWHKFASQLLILNLWRQKKKQIFWLLSCTKIYDFSNENRRAHFLWLCHMDFLMAYTCTVNWANMLWFAYGLSVIGYDGSVNWVWWKILVMCIGTALVRNSIFFSAISEYDGNFQYTIVLYKSMKITIIAYNKLLIAKHSVCGSSSDKNSLSGPTWKTHRTKAPSSSTDNLYGPVRTSGSANRSGRPGQSYLWNHRNNSTSSFLWQKQVTLH